MMDALNTVWVAFSEFAPRLLGAGLVLLIAFLAARFLQRLGTRLLQRIGLDDVFERTGTLASLERVGLATGPSVVFGYVVFWAIVLAGAASALSILGLASLQANVDLIVALAGRALVAVLILAGGLAAAGWLSGLTAREVERAGLAGGDVFRRAVFAAVLAVAALLAAAQLGIEVSLLIVLAVVFLGTVGLVAALALGLGLAPLSGNVAAGRYVRENLELGDEISVNGVEGTVEKIGYASVTLTSGNGEVHYVPNRALLEAVVSKRARREGSEQA
jgi:small-conductance mechanosensitive channel